MRGRFITLEGGEGVGKTTLAKALAQALRGEGREVVQTREPGGTAGADDIRALLVRGQSDRWSPLSETLLLFAARLDHLERAIRPALARGAWVICDRYLDSTFAYQVAGRGLSHTVIDTLSALIAADQPDLTLILDAPPAAAVARSRGRQIGEDRYEAMDAQFHENVRTAFLARARAEPARCVILDAMQPHELVHAAALAFVKERLT